MYLIINKINGFIEESNGNKYLTLGPTDERRDTLKKYEELRSKIKNLIRSITNHLHNCKFNNSNIFDEKYMKIKFNTD